MTVGELEQLLAPLPKDYPVAVEGCDCTPWANGVEVRIPASKTGVPPCVIILGGGSGDIPERHR